MSGIHEGVFSSRANPNIVEVGYRADPNSDELEKLIEKFGPSDAFEELLGRLADNPDDVESRRQANLLIHRYADRITLINEVLPLN